MGELKTVTHAPGDDAEDWHLTVADLVVNVPPVVQGTRCKTAFAMLIDNGEWPAVCVTDEAGHIAGMVSRRQYLTFLAKPLMLDLYNHRPVERIMGRSPLIVDASTTIDTVAQRIADEAPQALLDGFVITQNGRYTGLATAQNLLIRSVEQSRHRSKALAHAHRLAEEANVARKAFLANLMDVSDASSRATGGVQAMAAATGQIAASIENISRRLNEAAEIVDLAATAAGRTDRLVGGLSEVTQKMGNVVGFIQKVASQTHMLALNATIEAGRAGERGKGFAVVAGEVKQLAAQTATATGDIAAQIGAMQSAGQEAVSAIHEIVTSVRHIHGIATAIAATVEQQRLATNEIVRFAQDAAQGTSEVSSSISRVASEAEELLDGAGGQPRQLLYA